VTKAPKDIGASVRARLQRLARECGEDFQVLLTRYANERLLYRLASSRHASAFVLKGAALRASPGWAERLIRTIFRLDDRDPSSR
jgi:hypothetical protein